MAVTLHSSIRQRTQAGMKSLDGLEVSEITATAPTYDEAMRALESKLPESWILLGVRRLSDD